MKRGDLARRLVAWYCRGHRDLPWRRTSDPYRVLVSEIMLQQTRAQTVIPYYDRFLERFPTAEALAAAREDDVLALWSGLGYYRRARNLWRAAKTIAAAGFPRDYDGIRALPGVGNYTASAVASIAFGLPHAVVDGNVLRVVARVTNDGSDIGSVKVRARFGGVAQEWLGGRDPSEFNQALMELGATICLPKAPLCSKCPLGPECSARSAGTAESLPVNLRDESKVRIEGELLVIRRGGRTLLVRESEDAKRMAGFWRLPAPEELPAVKRGECLGDYRHTITRHRYEFRVFAASLAKRSTEAGFRWFRDAELAGIPLSTTARKALKLAGVG